MIDNMYCEAADVHHLSPITSSLPTEDSVLYGILYCLECGVFLRYEVTDAGISIQKLEQSSDGNI